MPKNLLMLGVFWICCFSYDLATVAAENTPAPSGKKYVCPPCGCSKDGDIFAKPGKCPDCRMPLIEMRSDRVLNVAIVVHDGVELLDFAGPGEVFAAASLHNAGSNISFNVYTVAPSPGTVISQGFVEVKPRYTIDDCPEPDILVIPGGRTRVLIDDEKFMAWAKGVTAKAQTTLTVCTGAFVVATNGQLDGLDATTHYGSISRLRNSFPKVKVHENRRFVDNGRIVTAAGVSAGIDGALHVVAKTMNFSAAKETAQYMEYEWSAESETMAGLSDTQRADAKRREQRNSNFKAAFAIIRDRRWSDAVTAFQEMTAAHPQDKESWYYLGLAHHQLEQWQEAIRANEQAAKLTGYSAHRPVYNIACAYARIGQTDHSLNALEQAIRLGMTDMKYIENDDDLASLRSEPRYRKIVASENR